ncbi:MAG: heme A synthase [Armatimonadetes bacterium]|nr:heme A synthase [Armatimonadota bacterium]
MPRPLRHCAAALLVSVSEGRIGDEEEIAITIEGSPIPVAWRLSFLTYARATLALTLLVILWGAFVRATGSGAGCGDHWPLCDGQVLPRPNSVEMAIEFTHRVTSGVALAAVAWMLVWSRRAFPSGHAVRLGAGLSMFFMVTEALVGAGLVLLRLVADNVSIARAVWMVAHLVNTFWLVGALTLTVHWAAGGGAIRTRGRGGALLVATFAPAAILVVSMSGAVTALGDTIFPGTAIDDAARGTLGATAQLLAQLRVWHPWLAIFGTMVAVAGALGAQRWRVRPGVRRWAGVLVALYVAQIAVGVVNILLRGPVWLQLVHLAVADAVWMSAVLLAASLLAHEPAAGGR